MPSLLEAIESKYSETDETGPQDGSFVIFAPKICARECVPSILVLDNCKVDSAGDEDRLAKLCFNVQELDLSHNQLVNWDDVSKILRQTQSAKFVNLSFNELSSPLEKSILPCMPQLRSLVLIGTHINWNSIWTILELTSSLEELHLSKNEFDRVEIPKDTEQGFNLLTRLTFDGNPIAELEISKLGKRFQNLKQLSLSNCPISSVSNIAFEQFDKLEVLNISNTLLNSRDEIVKLNRFRGLSELRVTGIPFLSELPDKERRQQLVALLPKLRKLNGGAVINSEERDAAERYYIRKYLEEKEKPVRYAELVEKHGTLDPLVEIKLKPVKKVTLKIIFGNLEVDKQVNLYQTVRDFKKFLEPIVGIESPRMVLYYNDVGLDYSMDVLKFPQKMLYSYNMKDGDEIHVEIKNKTGHEIDKA